MARGPNLEAPAGAEIVDLEGKVLLPKFVDAHLHILPMGLDLRKPNLSACTSHNEVLDALRDAVRYSEGDAWLHAVHYDQNRFGQSIHITRDQLDSVSSTTPILLRHSNGHASIANSAALQRAGVDESTPDPAGGKFERDASGRMNGVLLEDAHEIVTNAMPVPTLEEMVEAILAADAVMAERGIGTAADMMTGRFDLEKELLAYDLASKRGSGRYRLYVQWKEVFGPRALARERFDELSRAMDTDRCRVAGIKIFADGAIGSATAAIYGAYTGIQQAGPKISRSGKQASQFTERETSGQLIYAPDRLASMAKVAAEGGFQVATHCIGDFATDLVIRAYQQCPDPSRHRLEHCMLLSDAQIDSLAQLGGPVTFQPEFLLRFTGSYLRQLGPERTFGLKRIKSCLDAGISVSLSSDAPIVSGDPAATFKGATHRPTELDPAENLSAQEALFAMTAASADVNEDRGFYGRLEPGEVAEYLIAGQSEASWLSL